MELKAYVTIVKRRMRVVIVTTVVAIAVAGLGSLLQQPVYSATTTLRIAQAYTGSIEYADYVYSERLVNTYVQILMSRPILEEVTRRLELNVSPGNLAGQINIAAVSGTELLRIAVRDGNPARAKAIADVLATLLVEQDQSLYLGGAKSAREILQEQLRLVEDSLEQDRDRLQALLADSTADQERIDALRTKLQFSEGIYANLLQQYEEARLAEASRANSITVVEPALLPSAPSEPRTRRNLALGAAAGLLGGLGLAFVLENLDRTVHSAADLAATATSILGTIPRFAIAGSSGNAAVAVNSNGQSPASEAFRMLRVNILALDTGKPPKTLLIASAEAGAGKSMVLVNLAAALAEAGSRVVVVDGDLRHPCLHELLGLSNELGVRDILFASGDLDRALQQTEINKLAALTSGPLPTGATQPADLSKMRDLIEQLAGQADIVLLDSPPILSFADATVLAPMVDGVVLVTAQDETTGEHVHLALQQIRNVSSKTLGIVLNKASRDSAAYGHPCGRGAAQRTASMLRSFLGNLGQRVRFGKRKRPAQAEGGNRSADNQ